MDPMCSIGEVQFQKSLECWHGRFIMLHSFRAFIPWQIASVVLNSTEMQWIMAGSLKWGKAVHHMPGMQARKYRRGFPQSPWKKHIPLPRQTSLPPDWLSKISPPHNSTMLGTLHVDHWEGLGGDKVELWVWGLECELPVLKCLLWHWTL